MASYPGWTSLPVKWNEQEIEVSNQTPFIQSENKINIDSEYRLVCGQFTEELINQCVEFHRCNGITSNGNITLLSTKNLYFFKELGCYCIRALDDKKIVGLLLTIPVDFKQNEYRGKMMYTSFLCVHQEYRDKGLAMILIRKCVQLGNILGIVAGYQMVPRAVGASPVINIWYRPINYERAKKAGYQLNNYSRVTDRNKNRNTTIYNNKMPIGCDISLSLGDYEIYNELTADNSSDAVYWSPTKDMWYKWKEYSPVLTIRQNDKIIGQISYIHRHGFISATKTKVNIAEISWFNGSDIELIYRSLFTYLQKNNFDVVQWYSINGNRDDIGRTHRAVKSDTISYWLMFNWRQYPDNYCLPLI